MFRSDAVMRSGATCSSPPPELHDISREAILRRLASAKEPVTLDSIVDETSDDPDESYAAVADLVRDGRIVVEFESTPRPFPHRGIVVRLLPSIVPEASHMRTTVPCATFDGTRRRVG